MVGAQGRSLRPPWDLSAEAALQQGCGARPYRGGDGAVPGTAWMERLSPDTAACQVCGRCPWPPAAAGNPSRCFPNLVAPRPSPPLPPALFSFRREPAHRGMPGCSLTGLLPLSLGLRQSSASPFPPVAGRGFRRCLSFTFCSSGAVCSHDLSRCPPGMLMLCGRVAGLDHKVHAATTHLAAAAKFSTAP